MDLIAILSLAGAGVLAGILAGLLGIGGGIVLVPVLYLVYARAGVGDTVLMHVAVATSLATIIPTSLSSWHAHRSHGAVETDVLRRWAPAIVFGAAAGGVLARWVSGPVLTLLFALFALIIATRMLAGVSAEVRERPGAARFERPFAAVVGLVSTWMGIGGGSLSVPALRATGHPIHKAVGTAAALGFFIALPGTVAFVLSGWGVAGRPVASAGFVNGPGVLAIAPATMLFAPVGARLAHWLRPGPLTRIFALFLMLAAVRMALKAFGAFGYF